jgi:hypothetical protein
MTRLSPLPLGKSATGRLVDGGCRRGGADLYSGSYKHSCNVYSNEVWHSYLPLKACKLPDIMDDHSIESFQFSCNSVKIMMVIK